MIARDFNRRGALTALADQRPLFQLTLERHAFPFLSGIMLAFHGWFRGDPGCGIAATEEVARLSADGFDVDVAALLAILRSNEAHGGLDDVRVDRPGKSLVAGDDDQQDVL